MLYGALFLAVAAVLAWAAGGSLPGAVLYWPALNAALIGLGYLGLGASMLGKRSDGTRPKWSRAVFAPYYGFVWLAMRFLRGFSREDPWNEVAPGLFVGRRCALSELPPGITTVLDLTAELDVPGGLRDAVAYHTLPTLDGAAPDEAALRALVTRVASEAGPLYVHCAAGHARSALTAAAILLARGDEREPEELLSALRRARPRIGLSTPQRRLLRRLKRGP